MKASRFRYTVQRGRKKLVNRVLSQSDHKLIDIKQVNRRATRWQAGK